jgi:phage tail tape-measure protein
VVLKWHFGGFIMSIDLGVLGARVNLATGGFDKGIKTIVSGFSNIGNRAFKLNQSLELVGKGFKAIEASVKGSFGSFIEAADTADKYRVTLNTLLGSQTEGARMFDQMSKFAAKVPFEYENIMSSATALAGVMSGGVDEVTKWMPMIADLAAVSRLSIEETTGQIIRMYSAGAASADLFRERGILAMMGFQSGVQYSAEQTKKMLMDAYESPTSKFRNASAELAKTWSGMTSMMSDRWFILDRKSVV